MQTYGVSLKKMLQNKANPNEERIPLIIKKAIDSDLFFIISSYIILGSPCTYTYGEFRVYASTLDGSLRCDLYRCLLPNIII